MPPTTQPPTPAEPPRAGPPSPDQEVILLAITGMSPAILTETIWALAREPQPVIPERVIVVTTTSGREQLKRLFEPAAQLGGRPPWGALREDLSAAGFDLEAKLRFGLTGDDVRVITTGDGPGATSRELADLRSREDNAATADFLLDQVRALAANPDCRVVASLAGGRKTMGALLYACFTLAAREQDRLTHVLVSEPFETLPGFWFPTQPGGPLPWSRSSRTEATGETVAPASAVIELAEVPFVPLANLFRKQLGQNAGRFARLVDFCRDEVSQRSAAHLQLTINANSGPIQLNGRPLRLPRREHALLHFLAQRAKTGAPPFEMQKDAVDPLAEFIRAEFPAGPSDKNSPSRPRFADEEDVRRVLSDLRRILRGKGEDYALLADLLPEKGRFSLKLAGPQIFIR